MPYKKINKENRKIIGNEDNHAANRFMQRQPATSIVSPGDRALAPCAAGASASMADRAVRAARSHLLPFFALARAFLACRFTSSSLNIVPRHFFAPQ
jgi:hypothetical protein